mmetsp:Transcript_84174/g.272098  ORF Transcript_84174/g.272098 Transcript_84174/m.272098 type:complete len:206 (-) Transcript_84174:1385-2002(-)
MPVPWPEVALRREEGGADVEADGSNVSLSATDILDSEKARSSSMAEIAPEPGAECADSSSADGCGGSAAVDMVRWLMLLPAPPATGWAAAWTESSAMLPSPSKSSSGAAADEASIVAKSNSRRASSVTGPPGAAFGPGRKNFEFVGPLKIETRPLLGLGFCVWVRVAPLSAAWTALAREAFSAAASGSKVSSLDWDAEARERARG